MFHSRAKFIVVVLSLSIWMLPVWVSASPLPFEAPLSEKYLRVEVIVDEDFTSQCTQNKAEVTCKLSKYSQALLKVLSLDIKEGIKVKVVESRREVLFSFDDDKLRLQDRVLAGPPRWVIEIGYPETLIQSIEDELPFRPYPMPVQTVQLKRPSIAITKLPGDTDAEKTFGRCWDYWSQEEPELVKAYQECNKLQTMPNVNSEVRNAATKLKAEIVYKHSRRFSNDEKLAREYVGKEVFYIHDKIRHTVDKPDPIRYAITGKAQAATLVITNSDGQVVANDNIAEIKPGKIQEITWDGIDRTDKKSQLPTGTYTVSIALTKAPDADRSPSAQVYVKGKVIRYRSVQGLPKLMINDNKKLVNLSAVINPDSNKIGSEKPKQYFYMRSPDEDPRDKAIELLQAAQQASNRNERERARYILLTADLKSERSPSEAIEYLRERQKHFPQADPYLLAEEVRLLFQINSYDEAENVLRNIARLDITQDVLQHVKGSQQLALASLAYARALYTKSASLYREVHNSFPELLTQESGPLFQAAESFFREGSHELANILYQEFDDRFPKEFPNWIVKIRLAQLKAFKRPIEASNEMVALGQTLPEPEGNQLARLYSISLANKNNQMDSTSIKMIFDQVSNGAPTPTPYVLEELWLQQARSELQEGNLEEAFKYSQKIVREFPNSLLLQNARLFFQRLLLLQVDKLLREKRHHELFMLFLREKNLRFKQPQARSILHLYVARATRALNMFTIAIKMIQRGQIDEKYPRISALLTLEKTGIYRELVKEGDVSDATTRTYIDRFKRHVEEIQSTYLNKFDSYDYWSSLGYYHELQGDLRKAKQIYLYALNGPNMTPRDRLKLGESIFEVYEQIPDKEKGLHALKVLLQIHDEYSDELNMPVFRAKTLWRRVELCIDLNKWPNTVKAIKEYLQESQSLMSSQKTELFRTKDKRRQEELVSYIDLLHERRREALFYHGYALLKIGLVRQAKRQWDLLYKEASDGDPYGTLAEEELRMLTWRESTAPDLLKTLDVIP